MKSTISSNSKGLLQRQIRKGVEATRQHLEDCSGSLFRNKISLIRNKFVSLQREIIVFVCDE